MAREADLVKLTALVRPGAVLIELQAGEPHFSAIGLALRPWLNGEVVVAVHDPRAAREPGHPGGTERDPAHHLDAASDDDVMLTSFK